jgi:hypothetical protein
MYAKIFIHISAVELTAVPMVMQHLSQKRNLILTDSHAPQGTGRRQVEKISKRIILKAATIKKKIIIKWIPAPCGS